jgi:hypothetical protein
MVTRQWDAAYEELLGLLDIPTLEQRRTHLKLGLLLKIIHGMCYFPSGILTFRDNLHCRSLNPKALIQPFAHTNTFYYSFVPHSTSLWNSLTAEQVTAPSLASFKRLV